LSLTQAFQIYFKAQVQSLMDPKPQESPNLLMKIQIKASITLYILQASVSIAFDFL